MPQLLELLRARIAAHEATVGVIGLGYVGLPVGCMFADAGYRVVGVDVKAARVDSINKGENPIGGDEPGLAELLARVVANGRFSATVDYDRLSAADVVTINVETPVDDDDHRPRYTALASACRGLAQCLKRGALVIVESTVAPGTLETLVQPVLESTGRRAGEDFFLGHCPERVMPGKLIQNLRTVSRVAGGATPEVAEVMTLLYRQIVLADVDPTDVLTAELVKTAENAYRDINIAFANELALICAFVGGDVWKVRSFVNKSPGRNVLLPGAGVGGHCIPKDPWLLIAPLAEPDGTLTATARRINDSMPGKVAELALEALRAGHFAPPWRVVVLGYAYLENSDDTRNSPTAALVQVLTASGCEVCIHDPFVDEYQSDLASLVVGADALIAMVAHDAYRTLDLQRLASSMRQPVLVDGRRVFPPEALDQAGVRYQTLGVGRPRASVRAESTSARP